eukprot:CAMPEP_0174747442 /NCGR_PEP_ID=MMETSP1094-20130205/91224_1 /TAXON_ID=156173 /ORGANISM="Chrysochromulina brevifilum, Strain UTEX LB 985" /LENGTH=112 /DNA_ID=CAMNT_0015952319 /DNA_START=33 /DNA_END=371 /DNA_ORIENTATION=+
MTLPSFVPSMLSDESGPSPDKVDDVLGGELAGGDEDDASEQLVRDRTDLKLRSRAIVGHVEGRGQGGVYGTAIDADTVCDELRALCALDEQPSALIETSALDTPRSRLASMV